MIRLSLSASYTTDPGCSTVSPRRFSLRWVSAFVHHFVQYALDHVSFLDQQAAAQVLVRTTVSHALCRKSDCPGSDKSCRRTRLQDISVSFKIFLDHAFQILYFVIVVPRKPIHLSRRHPLAPDLDRSKATCPGKVGKVFDTVAAILRRLAQGNISMPLRRLYGALQGIEVDR